MALEEQIVAWSSDRPHWQRVVLARVAAGEAFTDSDYDQLVEDILASRAHQNVEFGLGQLPKAGCSDVPVRLVSIEKPVHVNALASDNPLTFQVNGLTIVYGDNASGKSGYARLLKRIARSRHREDVLSDVFRDTRQATPTASVTVRIGEEERTFAWPEASAPDLQRMLYYDATCGSAYISMESDFPYRPSALFVMDGLIEACVEVRSRIDARLQSNSKAAKAPPVIDDEVKDTEAGMFVSQLSGRSSVEVLDALIKRCEQSPQTVKDLMEQEARLRTSDTNKERQRLARQAEKLDAVHRQVEVLHAGLGDQALQAFQEQRTRYKSLESAAEVPARSFESEPLAGVGSSTWKDLWESARRFSEAHAYPDRAFPVVESDSRCVLCHQALKSEATNRLSRFERFVSDDTQVRLRDAREAYDGRIRSLTNLAVRPDAVMTNLQDLAATHADLVTETEALLGRYDATRTSILTAIRDSADFSLPGVEPAATLGALRGAAAAARVSAEALADPAIAVEILTATTRRRKELELLQAIRDSQNVILAEIKRLKEREALEAAKNDAATGPITRKILEFSEESITEVVRDSFTRETERLKLERVTIAKTRADKGALLHQPKLVGARQQVTLPRVFSEGERTALGLAAFFTEAQLDDSRSALILDDPVTSLDHIRRGLVASRLAALAETRQVLVFTHDVSFVADLKREANGKGVPMAERSVVRSRAEERRPGVCTTKHPWKAKDVAARIDELRNGLARIKQERNDCDEAAYEKEVADWAGSMSETWERIFSQEIVGAVLAEGGLEVRPNMVKVLARFSDVDEGQFQASYRRVSQWAKRHDKSVLINYVAPEIEDLEEELKLVDSWFKRVKGYKN